MQAPGYQGALFPGDGPPTCRTWRVVDVDGRRHRSTTTLVLAVGQARALALAEGRAWIVGDERDAVEVVFDGQTLAATPRGPGWPSAVTEILAQTAREGAQP